MSGNKGSRRKIICVDDVNFVLFSLKDRLKKHYEVFPAQSAEKLFELLAAFKPDLILLDIGMPEISGYDIIKSLKADANFAEIPVIFLTGNTDRSSVIQAFDLGAVDILFKPVADATLVERIEYQFSHELQKSNQPVILAVDDSPSILKSVNHALSDKYKVYTLPRSEAISDVLKRTVPDLFLLDCNMPKLSGFDLIDIIRKKPMHEETPILFLTSERDKDTIFAAMGLGVSDYIAKPIDEEVLKQKVALHLNDFIKRRIIRSLTK